MTNLPPGPRSALWEMLQAVRDPLGRSLELARRYVDTLTLPMQAKGMSLSMHACSTTSMPAMTLRHPGVPDLSHPAAVMLSTRATI